MSSTGSARLLCSSRSFGSIGDKSGAHNNCMVDRLEKSGSSSCSNSSNIDDCEVSCSIGNICDIQQNIKFEPEEISSSSSSVNDCPAATVSRISLKLCIYLKIFVNEGFFCGGSLLLPQHELGFCKLDFSRL